MSNELELDGDDYRPIDFAQEGYVGQMIAGIDITESHLMLRLQNGQWIRFKDQGQSCCENRYMRTDDQLKDFEGSKFIGAELREGQNTKNEDLDVHETQFLDVKTSAGVFTVVTHNEHNGWYGGFCVQVTGSGRT